MIIAIDPGPVQSAMVWWDGKEILRHEILSNEKLLDFLRGVDTGMVVIEMVASYGMPVGKSIFETVLFIGRCLEAAKVRTELVYRGEIKDHFCKSRRAKDSNIRQTLIDRFGEPGKKKTPGLLYKIHKDEWSALAIAVFWFDKNGG